MTNAGWRTEHGAVVFGNVAAMQAHRAAVATQLQRATIVFESGNFTQALIQAQHLVEREPGNLCGNYVAGMAAL